MGKSVYWGIALSWVLGFSANAAVSIPEQAVGFYNQGTLVNASRLPVTNINFLGLFESRDRHWGTYQLLQLLVSTGNALAQKFPGTERLQIGDTAAKTGGYISGHGSHQNGLDADLVYLRHNHWEQDPADLQGFVEGFVEKGRLTANFDIERNWELAKTLVHSQIINRIFVDSAIKSALCAYSQKTNEYQQETETLRRLRPWPNHHDHMHVRIKCPTESPRCTSQEEPPEGSGCDKLE